MKALTQRGRRHPFAFVALLLLGLLLTGGLYAAAATTVNEAQASNVPDGYSTEQVEEGERLFVSNCATCHGMNADGTDNGYSLVGVGAASVEFQVGTGRMPLQMQGPQAQQKPPQFNDEQTSQMAAYVGIAGRRTGCARGCSTWMRTRATPPAVVSCSGSTAPCATTPQQPAAHSPRGSSRRPLMGSIRGSHYTLAMSTGPQNMPVYNDANIPPEDKRDIIAFLKNDHFQSSPGGFSLGSFGPVSEGLLIWTLGLALLIGSMVWLTSRSPLFSRPITEITQAPIPHLRHSKGHKPYGRAR